MARILFDKQPGSVEINYITITSRAGEVNDITNFFQEIDISETIDNFVTVGYLLLLDTVSLKEFLPIIGGEKIKISFRTADEFEWFDGEYIVTKIGAEVTQKHGKGHKLLKLYFASEPLKLNFQRQYSKSYQNKFIHQIVRDVWDHQLGGFDIEIDPTENYTNFIIPYWNPFTTIQRLSQKAISAKYTDSGYLFYQDKLKYRFVPLSHLMQKPPMSRAVVLHKVYDAPGPQVPHTSGFIGDAKNFDYNSNIDILQDLKNGVQGGTVYTFDYTLKHFMKRGINWQGYYDTDAWNVGDRTLHEATEVHREALVNEFTGFMVDKITNTLAFPLTIDQQSKNILRNRNRYNQMSSYNLVVNKNGDSNITCGLVVLVKYMSRDTDKVWHDRLYGNYLVKGVKHVINASAGYTQVLSLVKDAFWSDDHGITKKIGGRTNPGKTKRR